MEEDSNNKRLFQQQCDIGIVKVRQTSSLGFAKNCSHSFKNFEAVCLQRINTLHSLLWVTYCTSLERLHFTLVIAFTLKIGIRLDFKSWNAHLWNMNIWRTCWYQHWHSYCYWCFKIYHDVKMRRNLFNIPYLTVSCTNCQCRDYMQIIYRL